MATQHVVGIDASRISVEQRTGTENYSHQITRALLALDVPWEWRLYTNDPTRAFPMVVPGNASIRPISSRKLWTHYRLSREMITDRPSALFVPAHVVPLVHPRSVVTIHDLGYLHVPEAHPVKQRRMLDLTTRWSARVARSILVPSSRTRDDLIGHYDVPEDKITVIHHGVDARYFDEGPVASDDVRRKYGLTRPYVLAVGTIQPRKNLPLLAQSMFASSGEHDLVIAGKRGWMAELVLKELEAAGLGDRLRILDYVPDTDLRSLYAGADLFVQPSAFEGFGMPVLEAMAAGAPVVSAPGSSLEEIGGDAAVFFDAYTKDSLAFTMRTLLQDPGTRRSMASLGRAWAARFTWERAAEKTRMIIENTLT